MFKSVHEKVACISFAMLYNYVKEDIWRTDF